MDNMFKIIHGESIPEFYTGNPGVGRWISLANQMNVGDSVRVTKSTHAQGVRSGINSIDKGVSKATVRKRKTDDGKVFWQIWRIA